MKSNKYLIAFRSYFTKKINTVVIYGANQKDALNIFFKNVVSDTKLISVSDVTGINIRSDYDRQEKQFYR